MRITPVDTSPRPASRGRATRMALALAFALLAALSGCGPAIESHGGPTGAPTPALPPANEPAPLPSVVLQAPEEGVSLTIDDIDGIVTDPSDVLPPKRPYEAYRERNPDVVGWITVPNTQIDYPVVLGDNNEYYLTHNVEKAESKHGAIFMDYRNQDPEQQLHLILYGHNMKNGTMFHDLNNYKSRDFFDNEENRRITFVWNGVEMEWEVYLACVWQWDDVYFHHTRFSDVDPKQNFADIMNAIKDYAKKSKYSNLDESVIITSSDQVLTLSTCTYEYNNVRYIVSARRVR